MSFSKEWNEIYRSNAQMTEWPFSDLISYVMRYARPSGKGCRVLELGCGAGAHVSFFKSLGVEYFGIEGSDAVVEKLLNKRPELKGFVEAGDFTDHIPFSGTFDLVVDRSSVTHNSSAGIRSALKLVAERLVPSGKFIGIDWFSTAHSDYQNGIETEDEFTRCGYKKGQFAGVGRVHFSSKEHLQDLFSSFIIETLEHKLITKEIPGDRHVYALWNLVARRL